MRSPFPGMDPYLEASDVWPDLHDRLAGQISAELNRTLPPPYYARLEMRPEVGILGSDEPRRVVPDVTVVRPRRSVVTTADVAVLEEPRRDLSRSVRVRIPHEPLRHHFVEVRDASRGHTLVTLIELVSPSNKRRGSDRRAYEAKQQEVLDSDASLIEVDLLRAGEPVVGGPFLADTAAHWQPRADYVVGISRAWQRGADVDYEVFPICLQERLPCFPVPLRQHVAEVPLDLQYVFDQAYESGPYARGAVDYREPLDPPLRPELTDWLAECFGRWMGKMTNDEIRMTKE